MDDPTQPPEADLYTDGLTLLRYPPQDVPPGVMSWIGGTPSLPPGTRWPKFKDEDGIVEALEDVYPQEFLAQIALAELPDFPNRHLLPASGMLYFFAMPLNEPPDEEYGTGYVLHWDGDPALLTPQRKFSTAPLWEGDGCWRRGIDDAPYALCPIHFRSQRADDIQPESRFGLGATLPDGWQQTAPFTVTEALIGFETEIPLIACRQDSPFLPRAMEHDAPMTTFLSGLLQRPLDALLTAEEAAFYRQRQGERSEAVFLRAAADLLQRFPSGMSAPLAPYLPALAQAQDHNFQQHVLLGEPKPVQMDPRQDGEVLLLQLDSDHLTPGFQFWDMGTLCFLIDSKALAKGRFNRVRVQVEGH